METKSLLTTAGISLIVSTAVVFVNNYFFYKYVNRQFSQNVCKKEVCDF